MCGFGGILNNSFLLNEETCWGIAQKSSFRGPDSCRIRLYDEFLQASPLGNNAIFFNRLAIIDLDARSNQPFEDDRYTLVFNGEIYNYLELKKELLTSGYNFKTTSDTEVLFFALQCWGTAGLSKLNGMFSFCWIDRKKKTVVMARDRMGIKPLCYRQQGKALLFGSEIDSILRMSHTLPTINEKAIQHFLWMQYIPTPLTILKGVYKLPPGHFIELDLQSLEQEQPIRTHAYWDAFASVKDDSQRSNHKTLEGALVNSLSRQLIADVPLGLFLSSGVDSSLLTALVNKHFAKDQDFNFFTVSFSETTSSDESKDAHQFIRGFNNPRLISHLLEVNPHLIRERLTQLYDYFDEPFGDYTCLLNWVISSKAKEHVTVALSGDGADELFWGYQRYNQWQKPSLGLNGQLSIPGPVANLIKHFLPNTYWKTKAALELEADPLRRHFSLFLSPSLGQLVKDPPWEQGIWALDDITRISNRKDLTALLDLKTYLSDAMLYKVDRASMAASLEVRVPYLDNEVVDYALSSPLQSKSNQQFRNKASLKRLLMDIAPHYDIHRPKKGFNFPLDQWMRREWKALVLSMVTKENLISLGLDSEVYLPMVNRYYSGEKRLCIAVWYLLNLLLWHRNFIKKPVLKVK